MQNAYIQAGSDLGVLGFALATATVLAAIGVAAGAALRGPPGSADLAIVTVSALIVAAFEWAALGLVPGIPVTALLWLALGAGVALPQRDAAGAGPAGQEDSDGVQLQLDRRAR